MLCKWCLKKEPYVGGLCIDCREMTQMRDYWLAQKHASHRAVQSCGCGNCVNSLRYSAEQYQHYVDVLSEARQPLQLEAGDEEE